MAQLLKPDRRLAWLVFIVAQVMEWMNFENEKFQAYVVH